MKQLPNKIEGSISQELLFNTINSLISYLEEREEKKEICGVESMVDDNGRPVMFRHNAFTYQNPKGQCPTHDEKEYCVNEDKVGFCHKCLTTHHGKPSPQPTEPKIKVVVSDRIDYCCECGKMHGYDCPLEKPTEQDWEKQFTDRFFVYEMEKGKADHVGAHHKAIDFISKLISQAKANERAKIREMIEKVKFENIGSTFETEELKEVSETGMTRTKMHILSHLTQ